MDKDINKEIKKKAYERPTLETLRFEAKENLAANPSDSDWVDPDGPGWGPWV